MDNINLALQSLKKGVSHSKDKLSPDIETAMTQLSVVPQLLVNPINQEYAECYQVLLKHPAIFNQREDPLPDESFLKLGDRLRHTIQPLYRQNLDLALNFSCTVFSALQKLKVLPAKGASSRTAWEIMQSSILSGLLDHLDDHRTVKVKGPICQAFFPSLCKLYFPTTPEERPVANSDLLTTVFMLISELVCGHAAGAASFRKALDRGRRLGYVILGMRDFLPLEAALELFANLLFSFKNGKSDRTKFIKDVFGSSSVHSPQLLATLENVASPSGWENVSSDVINILSSSDIASPQPIDVSNFQLKGLQTESVDRVYLESASVVLSIPSDEGDDTLIIPFRHIAGLQVSTTGGDVFVSFALNKPPILGKKPLWPEQVDTIIQCHWSLATKDLFRFLNVLKHRKVPFSSSRLDPRRKLSITKAISLDLGSDMAPPKPTQEKAITIAKLWDGQSLAVDNATTSPLLNAIFSPESDKPNAIPPLADSIVQGGSLVDQREQDTDAPSLGDAKDTTASKDALLRRSLSLLMSTSNPSYKGVSDARIGTTRQRKRDHVIVSEDEETDGDAGGDQDYAPSSPTPSRGRRSPRLQRVSRAPALARIPEGRVLPGPPESGRDGLAVRDAKKRSESRTRSTLSKENESPAKLGMASSRPPKRPATLGRGFASDDEHVLPPAKKARRSPENNPKANTKTRPKPQRNSKMKTSTPAMFSVAGGGDDEPPELKPKKDTTIAAKARVAETQRRGRRASQMKDKTGNSKPRHIPVTKRTTRASANERANLKHDKDIETEGAVPTTNTDERAGLMSTAVSIVEAEAIAANPGGKGGSKPSSHKPQKAVWQRDSFVANLESQMQSTPVRCAIPEEISDPIHAADEEVPGLPEGGGAIADGRPAAFVAEPPLAEYYVPIKGESDASPIPNDESVSVKQEPEVTMIDLTSPGKGSLVSPIPMPVRSSTPPPAPVKRGREAVDHFHDVQARPGAPAPTQKSHGRQLSGLYEPKEQPVTNGVGRSSNTSVRGDADGDREELSASAGSATTKRRGQPELQRSAEESEFGSSPPKRRKPQPIDRIIQHYRSPQLLRVHPRQRTIDEEWRQDHRPPAFAARGRLGQRAGVHPNHQRLTGELATQEYGFVKSFSGFRKEVHTSEPMADITEVLRTIQEAVSDRLSNRFEEARQEMTQAQVALLRQAADNLRPMANEAEEHFVALVDLEAQYGIHRRKILTSIDTFHKSTSQLTGALRKVVQEHNRNSLAKKFPTKLFSKPVRFDLDWRL